MWTRKLKGERVSDDLRLDDSWQPSSAHMAIARLHSNGFIKFVATTNVDDLHVKSGVPKDSLAELHGNSFVEECEKCLKPYKRSFVTRNATGLFEHHTGRHQSSEKEILWACFPTMFAIVFCHVLLLFCHVFAIVCYSNIPFILAYHGLHTSLLDKP